MKYYKEELQGSVGHEGFLFKMPDTNGHDPVERENVTM